MIRAIIFDMDGVLFDSEPYWERARAEYVAATGHRWTADDELQQKGRSSREWAHYIQEHYAPQTKIEDIIAEVARRQIALYQQHLPLLPGAKEIVRKLARRYPLALASSSPPNVIEYALTTAGLRDYFRAVVSSDQVGRGKPNPAVFLAAAEQLGVKPDETAIFEDSSSGIEAAARAGAFIIAVPNSHYPPSAEALARANLVLPDLTAFRVEMLPTQ
jgi:HAD superfamily hydrolase (TIGR01509 family)